MVFSRRSRVRGKLIKHHEVDIVFSFHNFFCRKEEFIKLYEQHVAPIASTKGDFSSDDDEETESPTTEVFFLFKVKLFFGVILYCIILQVHSNSLNGNGIDVTGLSDEELFAQLQFYGIPAGPILGTISSSYNTNVFPVITFLNHLF